MTFIAVIVLIIWMFVVQGRVGDLETQVKKLTGEDVVNGFSSNDSHPTTAPHVSSETTELEKEIPEPAIAHEQVFRTTKEDSGPSVSMEDLLIKKILPTVGVLSVVLGVGFLVTWSYSNGLIGPKGLVLLGAVFSLFLVVAAELLREKFPKYFAYLSVAGLLGFSTSIYAGHQVYEFIADTSAFAGYVAVLAAGIGLALRYNNRIMSVLVVIGSFFVPVIMNSSEPNYYILVWYTGIIFCASALVYTKKTGMKLRLPQWDHYLFMRDYCYRMSTENHKLIH